MGENEIWCHAWRLLVKHQVETEAVIAREIARCRAEKDADGAAYWRKVAAALEDFR
ncbi:MAG: hypothetical protein WCF85_05360 [Rhodospirillaceae bacterium]